MAAVAWAIRRASSPNQYGFVFAVAEVKVNYRKPARLDDELLITCVPVPEGRGVDPLPADHLARRRRCSPKARCASPASMRRLFVRGRLPDFINLKVCPKVSDGQ